MFDADGFDAAYHYDGPLGAEYAPQGTTLRLWAPTAQQAEARLYHAGNGGMCFAAIPMQRGARGLWTAFLPGDRAGQYYTYAVTVDGETRETIDPYARAAGVNGLRGMILSAELADPKGWQDDHRPDIPAARRVIWEVDVRDFSADPASGVRLSSRGRYLAFAQQDATLQWDGVHPTCLSHLRRLGVSYVQLMPIFDFGSIDEEHPSPEKYNWGYDPVNFNLPEGSYSSDPYHGEVRVREVKQMVAALHAAGIGVVMDVVYNHLYRWQNPLNDTVPYYYFRLNADGTPANGSGCGNETASERPMFRRFVLDSLVYWATEYHIDGFRFDLMGLLDVDTMNAARAALDALPGGKSILLYGEPWQGGFSAITGAPADKAHIGLLDPRIGVFSDGTRDSIKGGCFEARAAGYVSGRWDSQWDVGASMAAWCRSEKFRPRAPSQIISYLSAHDNYTLWDKLLLVRYEHPDFAARDEAVLRQNRLAAGICLTSLGTPFMLAGEEFARTKDGDPNSFSSPLARNRLDWARAQEYRDLVDYYRGLIGLRAHFPRLASGRRETAEAMEFFRSEQPIVAWTLAAEPGDGARWQALAVYCNPLEAARSAALPAGQWQLLCDGISSSRWRGEAELFSGMVPLPAVSISIYGRVG